MAWQRNWPKLSSWLAVSRFEKAADSRRPDLLIHDLTGQPDEELDTIQMLLETQRVDQVFLTGESPDADVLMKAMRVGVKEFFSQPINDQEVKSALQRFRETHRETSRLKTKKKGQVIGVFGCKGGVGTTTVAVNLATSLHPQYDGNDISPARHEHGFWRNTAVSRNVTEISLGRDYKEY